MGRGISVLGTATLMFAAGLSSLCLAAAGRPANPPPPSAATEEAARAWVRAYIYQDDYTLAGLVDDRAMLFDPASVTMQDGQLSAVVRGELFKSQRIGRVQQRSFRDRWLFDCAAKTAKEVFSEGFPQSNLQGRPEVVDVSKADWTVLPEDTGEGRLMAQVCSVGSLVRSGVDQAKAMPPVLHDIDEAGTAAWMKRYVDAGASTMLHTGSGVGVFFDPAQTRKAASGRPQVWLRTELGVTLPTKTSAWRSMRALMEIDCLEHRYLRTSQQIFPGSNLLGTALAQDEIDEGWTDVTAGSTDAKWLTPLCLALSGKTAAAPPAPAGRDEAAVRDWLRTYINTNNFVFVTTTDVGAWLYGTEDLAFGEGGHILGTMRLEQFQASSTSAGPIRSGVQRIEFDCRGDRQRVIGITAYAESNLGGSSVSQAGTAWQKQAPGSAAGHLLRLICSQASLIALDDPALSMPTPLRGDTDAAREEWIDAHVDPTDYLISGYGDEAAILYSAKEIERTRQDYVRVWARIEYFRPDSLGDVVIRSMRQLYEFDCDQHRARTLAVEAFPGANLTGTKIESEKAEAEWSFIGPQTVLSGLANEVCDLKDEADDDARDPAKALPSSSGRQAL